MIGLLTRNIGWKLLALFAAILLWVSVSSEPELSTFATVPVEYKNLPNDLVINSDVVATVNLELSGASGELRDINESSIAVVLDMSDIQSGVQTFSIGNDNVKLPRGVRLIGAVPSQLRFDFERRMSRNVPVEVRFSDGPPSGYEISDFHVTPSSLAVEGPESRIKKIKTVITDPIDLSSVVAAMEFHVNVFVDDERVSFKSNPQVTINVVVRKKEPNNKKTGMRGSVVKSARSQNHHSQKKNSIIR